MVLHITQGKRMFLNQYDIPVRRFCFMIADFRIHRFPGQKDPPYEPTKLLMVQRVKPVKGNPYWDKKLLRHFRLDGKVSITYC
jgi:hypothetical protein